MHSDFHNGRQIKTVMNMVAKLTSGSTGVTSSPTPITTTEPTTDKSNFHKAKIYSESDYNWEVLCRYCHFFNYNNESKLARWKWNFGYGLIGIITSTSCCIHYKLIVSSKNAGSYGADSSAVSVSGLGSGGFMAVQIHVAESDRIIGAGAVEGGRLFHFIYIVLYCIPTPPHVFANQDHVALFRSLLLCAR